MWTLRSRVVSTGKALLPRCALGPCRALLCGPGHCGSQGSPPQVRGFVWSRVLLQASSAPEDTAGAAPSEAAAPQLWRPHPISKRFAHHNRPFFPIWVDNLRDTVKRKRKKRRGIGMSGRQFRKTRNKVLGKPFAARRTHEGGTHLLHLRLPKWPQAMFDRRVKKMDFLNLRRLRYFIEQGRLDTNYPITQRHLLESKCMTRIKTGVALFNTVDYPFPYKIDIEVAAADQSSVDAIRAVGGTITVVYMERVNLRAHLKPWKFEVLPRTARPTMKVVHALEKMKARGALVRYIKPLWLIEEERRLEGQLRELQGQDGHKVAERLARENERIGV